MGASAAPRSRIIVCDTGPLLHLMQIDRLDLLTRLGQVFIPSEVHHEWQRLEPTRSVPPEFRVVAVEAKWRQRALEWVSASYVDLGEAMALALALQVQANWFLTDDAAARVLASSLGVEVHGSLGVVLASAAYGYLSYTHAREAINALGFESTLWVSNRVVQAALQALEDIRNISDSQ
jgi:predicted nucleic acid-binding protein